MAGRSQSMEEKQQGYWQASSESSDASTGLVSGPGFPADNIVPLDHRRHAHVCIFILHSAVDANNFTQGSNKYLATVRYFRRQSQRDIQLRASFQILIDDKIQTSRGNVSRLALSRS